MGLAGQIWYFAYGSNLDPGTFYGRRRMRATAARVARLTDYELVFDLPVGKGERGVANVLEAPGRELYGVAYRISEEQAHHLDRTEGVPRAYQRRAVVLDASDAPRLDAFTYVSPHRQADRKPSRRYLGLLLRGARYHGLPRAWIDHLRGLEIAIDERAPQRELFD